jgi:hypothetical protein
MPKPPPIPDSVEKIVDTVHVQKAKVSLPIDAFQTVSVQDYKDALAVVQLVRDSALAVLDVDEKNADVTAVDYELVGENAVVTVTQVNT